MVQRLRVIWGVGTALAVAMAAAAQPLLTDIGVLPGQFNSYAKAVSADGSTVVGYCRSSASQAFRWTRQQGIQPLGVLPGWGYSQALGVSADGTVVVGACTQLTGQDARAFRWTAGGMVAMSADPVGGPEAPTVAIAVSPDGSIAAGYYRESAASVVTRAARWSDGIMSVLPVDNPSSSSWVVAAAQGGVLAGMADNAAVRWPASGPALQLGSLAPGVIGGTLVYGMTASGSTIVGVSPIAPGLGFARGAFHWTSPQGIESLGLSGAGLIAYAASEDGRVIVGGADTSSGATDAAFVWSDALGVVDLRTYLQQQGVSVQGVILRRAVGISADGTTVAGVGSFGADDHAFIITGLNRLRACSPADVASLGGRAVSDGQLTSDDIVAYLAAFFEGGVGAADMVGPGGSMWRDGQLTADDVVFFLGRFFAGCP